MFCILLPALTCELFFTLCSTKISLDFLSNWQVGRSFLPFLVHAYSAYHMIRQLLQDFCQLSLAEGAAQSQSEVDAQPPPTYVIAIFSTRTLPPFVPLMTAFKLYHGSLVHSNTSAIQFSQVGFAWLVGVSAKPRCRSNLCDA